MTALAQPLTYILAVLAGLLTLFAIQFDTLSAYFLENLVVNAMILGVFVFGTILSFQRLASLAAEVRWLNQIRAARHASEAAALAAPAALKQVQILTAFASVWRRLFEANQVLTPDQANGLLDSAQARLDDRRELSRYLVTTLVILGLLGTFWGLLGALLSMRESLGNLDADRDFFAGLSGSLSGPLENMGTAFSSSLFGLAASLIFGFVELQTSKAHAKFLEEFEDWLASFTQAQPPASAAKSAAAPVASAMAEASLEAERLRHLVRRSQQDTMVVNNNLVTLLDQMSRLLDTTSADRAVQERILAAQADQQALVEQIGALITTIQGAVQYPDEADGTGPLSPNDLGRGGGHDPEESDAYDPEAPRAEKES